MLHYADPDLCPDCRAPLPKTRWSCPSCDLPLHGPVAMELFQTLQRADVLLSRLRTEATAPAPTPVPVPVAERRPEAQPHGSAAALLRRTGLRTTSVPAILLALGALCLLVAAITFLAVAWSWMGVGGRTGVLVGLTAASAGAGVLLGGRGLRVAGESLTTVALGLVALDVVGAITAGWLRPPDDAASMALIGAAVAAVSGAILGARSRLVAAQLGVTLGLVIAFTGLAGTTGRESLVAFVAVLGLRAVLGVGRVVGARVLTVSALVAGIGWWSWLLLAGLVSALADPSLNALWTTDNALPLLGAAALLLLPAVDPCPQRRIRVACASGSATIVTLLLGLPALDEGPTASGLTLLVMLAAWSGIAAAARRELAYGPLVLAAVPALAWTAVHLQVAVDRVWSVGEPFTSTVAVRLAPTAPETSPLLLVPLVAALLGAAWVTRLTRDRVLAIGALAVAAVATLASYGVPLAAVVGALALAAIIAAWFRQPGMAPAVAVVAVSAALPSAALTAACCAAALAATAVLLRARNPLATLLGGALLPAASAGLVWSLGETTGVAIDLRGLPVLVVVGAIAIAWPRVEVETSAALAGLVAAAAAVDVAADQPTSLAIHLTAAGVLVTLSSLLHADRRVLAWPGGLLLAAATWVRLADLGVEAPEAYTLPSALVLVMVALDRLRRHPGTSTAVLLPGLTLATVPSLLWVLVDPVSPRAVLLGVACLGLVLLGAQLRWSVPLAVGAVVGTLLVVREVAPYASEVPQWVLIGFAGTVLTVVGVTWEQRILELRRATTYLGRLR